MRTIIIPQNFWRQTKSNYLLYLVIQNVKRSSKFDIQHALFVMIDFSKIIGLTYQTDFLIQTHIEVKKIFMVNIGRTNPQQVRNILDAMKIEIIYYLYIIIITRHKTSSILLAIIIVFEYFVYFQDKKYLFLFRRLLLRQSLSFFG